VSERAFSAHSVPKFVSGLVSQPERINETEMYVLFLIGTEAFSC